MTESSPRLALPFLMPAQAQKHITHNEALERLDALVQLVVEEFDAALPPPLPEDGKVWALGLAAGGDWSGQAGNLALRANGGWLFIVPQAGWRAALGAEIRVWSGTDWVSPTLPALQNLPGVGINTSYDGTNKLALAADASLFSHDGGGHQIKVNKAASGDTGSLLFQTGWSGRAEMGTTGSDTFALKVSADGATWFTALSAAPGSGAVTMPSGALVGGAIGGSAVQANGADVAQAARLVRTDGALAAGLSAFGTAHGPLAGVNIDTVTAGDAGLYDAGNPGTWPLGAGVGLWFVTTQRLNTGGGVLQTATRHVATGTPSAAEVFTRLRSDTDGLWSGWAQTYSSRTILGSVAQLGGVPTGAVFESGTNANGRYLRLANGTQICWQDAGPSLACATAAGAIYTSSAATWTFPVAFVAGVVVQATTEAAGRWATARETATTTAEVQHFAGVSSATSVVTRLIAVGRWF